MTYRLHTDMADCLGKLYFTVTVKVSTSASKLYFLAVTFTVIVNKNYKPHELYRVIHKSHRDFRPLRYSSRDGHAEGEHVNRWINAPSFCPTLQVLDMSTLGDAEVPAPHVQCTCVAGT